MAKPRVFISSTYYDLKHVRASLEVFVESLGFEPILAEYGSIAYDPSQPLDESCYREAQSSDILVLIIGGRYGSIVSTQTSSGKKREEELESITRREFSRAHDADIPVFVLIEQGVFLEYQTYLRNKENSSITYAHVDSVDVFKFIEFIYSKQRNNPIQAFEKGVDIESWLRDQWAGIFQELLRQKKDNSKFSDLAAQIRQLEAINSTLKSYLETVLQSVSPDKSTEIIERENKSLSQAKIIENLRSNGWFNHLTLYSNVTPQMIIEFQSKISGINDVLPVYREMIENPVSFVEIMEALIDFEGARRDFNRMREILSLKSVRFSKNFLAELEMDIQQKRRDPSFKSQKLATLGIIEKSNDDADE